ncbi:hypothetical protein J2Y69_001554 [Microbacterium resistens]|uniref:Pr6Pr family membrane protein n=1 Tax=Microbacterium resistens TaxID=156977 RepID=A0ABU1SBJ0_9MICO|nr:Pr6Pr family membrane protein [Microbacterium resistens]MDR6866955.1 hypothetical protein [Microbacterium resistens]
MTSPVSAQRRAPASPAFVAGWSALRLAGAALLLVTVLSQLSMTVSNALSATTPAAGHLPTVIVNFFSYFTILSNVFAVIGLGIAGAWSLARGRDGRTEPRGLSVLLACVATFMIVTGIVYNLLLRNIAQVGISAPWINEVLHVLGPLLLLADVFFAPSRRRLGWGVLGAIAAFPIAWVVYTLLRANAITAPTTGNPWWYPYPFLDPHLVGGYPGVAAYVVGIALGILAVGAGVIWVSRRRGADS